MEFRIDVSDERLDWIRRRVREYEWPEEPESAGWAYGTPVDVMREVAAYWAESFDWRAVEAHWNGYAQRRAEIDGVTLHWFHVPGEGDRSLPLVLTHGWPGSFVEFEDVIGPLTRPSQFGGDAADAFDVIIPSLPGYGWSGRPPRPAGSRTVARWFARLLRNEIGVDRYVAQGGDWGSAVSAWLGRDDPSCIGIHLNMIGVRPGARPETAEEKEWAAAMRLMIEVEGAYFRVQATKPQSLAFAMLDSPVGAAAWILEKFHAWSDLRGGELLERYPLDRLLANVMTYVATRSFHTAAWMYRGSFDDAAALEPGERIGVPAGIAHFPADTWKMPPRSWVEKAYDVVQWTDHPRGGHFAAMEEPAAFVDDVRRFGRHFRAG